MRLQLFCIISILRKEPKVVITFYRKDIENIINLQPAKDGKAKPYQVKQVRDIILKYRLMLKQE